MQISRVFCAALFSLYLILWSRIDLVSSGLQLHLSNSGSPLGSASLPCLLSGASPVSWGSCRAHLIFYPYLRDLCPLLSDVQCLEKNYSFKFSLSVYFRWERKIGCCYSILIRSGSLSTFPIILSALLSFVCKLCPKAGYPHGYISNNQDLAKFLKSEFSLPLCCNIQYLLSPFDQVFGENTIILKVYIHFLNGF